VAAQLAALQEGLSSMSVLILSVSSGILLLYTVLLLSMRAIYHAHFILLQERGDAIALAKREPWHWNPGHAERVLPSRLRARGSGHVVHRHRMYVQHPPAGEWPPCAPVLSSPTNIICAKHHQAVTSLLTASFEIY
jgi:hypothetical protein